MSKEIETGPGDDEKVFVVAPDWDEKVEHVKKIMGFDGNSQEFGIPIGTKKEQYEIFLENQLMMLTRELHRVTDIRLAKDAEQFERWKKIATTLSSDSTPLKLDEDGEKIKQILDFKVDYTPEQLAEKTKAYAIDWKIEFGDKE